jgi:hypothetical protein
MLKVIGYTHLGLRVEKSYLEDKLGWTIARLMSECEDCKEVIVLDGFTGEILGEM